MIPADPKLAPRQKPRAAVIEAVFAGGGRRQIAEAIEDGERLALLQYAGSFVSPALGGEDVELVLKGFVHGRPPRASSKAPRSPSRSAS